MMNAENTFISISANRQHLGYAIFVAGKLTYYSIASLRRFRTQKLIYKAVDNLLGRLSQRFILTQIVIKDLNVIQKRSEFLGGIVNHIENFCLKQEVRFTKYSGQFVNQQFCPEDKYPTKEKTIRYLVEMYPELKFYADQKQLWQKRYYAHLFEAVAVGVTHTIEIENYGNNRK